jgi:hypothetical protein
MNGDILPPPPPPVGPPVVGTPMPPPPPPTLTAPAGYVAYQNGPAPAATVSRVGGLAKWVMGLVGVAGIAGVLSAVLIAPMIDTASDFIRGDISEDEFEDAYVGVQLVQGLQSIVGLAAGVMTIIWMYRISKNVRAYGRATTFAPVFSIFGWILPPFLYVLPLLILRELWKASDPETPAGSEGWKASKENPLLYVWFLVYGVIPAVITLIVTVNTVSSLFSNGIAGAGDPVTVAETLESTGTYTIASGGIALVAAIVWIVCVKQLTARHIAMTGET